jgi:hypothetical protein
MLLNGSDLFGNDFTYHRIYADAPPGYLQVTLGVLLLPDYNSGTLAQKTAKTTTGGTWSMGG